MADALTKLDEIAKLPPNWDSYGGATPWPENVETARRLIRLFAQPPCVVPGSSGSVQLEWYGEGFEIELLLDADGEANLSMNIERARPTSAGRPSIVSEKASER